MYGFIPDSATFSGICSFRWGWNNSRVCADRVVLYSCMSVMYKGRLRENAARRADEGRLGLRGIIARIATGRPVDRA